MTPSLHKDTERIGEDLLRLLRRTPKWTVHHNRLLRMLGTPKSHLESAITELQSEGYLFKTDRDSLSLVSVPDRMSRFEIGWVLKTVAFGRSLYCYEKVQSTNSVATELAKSGAVEGTLVVSEQQTKGRGRLGRSWASPAGVGIWMSIVLRPPPSILPEKAPGLSLIAGLAWAKTVERLYRLDPRLKWPNDGYLNGRKACGILTELAVDDGVIEYVVCGIGINVNQRSADFPPPLRSSATSIANAFGNKVERVPLLAALLWELEKSYKRFCADGFKPFVRNYRQRSVLLGQTVRCKVGRTEYEGEAIDFDERGALVISNERGETSILSGEATLRS